MRCGMLVQTRSLRSQKHKKDEKNMQYCTLCGQPVDSDDLRPGDVVRCTLHRKKLAPWITDTEEEARTEGEKRVRALSAEARKREGEMAYKNLQESQRILADLEAGRTSQSSKLSQQYIRYWRSAIAVQKAYLSAFD